MFIVKVYDSHFSVESKPKNIPHFFIFLLQLRLFSISVSGVYYNAVSSTILITFMLS